jgi:hypothetical protein
MIPPDVLLIGVDGGATNVRALPVRVRDDGLLEPAGARVELAHGGFEPEDIAVQQAEAGDVRDPRPPAEAEAASHRADVTARAIAEAAGDARRVALGICMPGVRTADGRGIAVLRNGPRSPRFLDELEARLRARGVQLAAPIPPLLGDGVAGALGERRASGGGLLDVGDAYWLAGGTGLAEAFLVGGRVRALDEFRGVVTKAWAMVSSPGIAYEDGLSMGGWNRAWWRAFGTRESAAMPVHVEDAALRGDPRAVAILEQAGALLGRLCVDRAERMREHAGVELARAIVGAHLGRLLARHELALYLREPAERRLALAGLPRDFLRVSRLADAAALGAAAFAFDRGAGTSPS